MRNIRWIHNKKNKRQTHDTSSVILVFLSRLSCLTRSLVSLIWFLRHSYVLIVRWSSSFLRSKLESLSRRQFARKEGERSEKTFFLFCRILLILSLYPSSSFDVTHSSYSVCDLLFIVCLLQFSFCRLLTPRKEVSFWDNKPSSGSLTSLSSSLSCCKIFFSVDQLHRCLSSSRLHSVAFLHQNIRRMTRLAFFDATRSSLSSLSSFEERDLVCLQEVMIISPEDAVLSSWGHVFGDTRVLTLLFDYHSCFHSLFGVLPERLLILIDFCHSLEDHQGCYSLHDSLSVDT